MSEKKTHAAKRPLKRKAKKPKKAKLEPKARIRRRLMKLWTMAVHAQFGEKCAVCGSSYKPNAHHIESRIMFKGLRYDPMNGVLLCPTHHKFGKDSAHMAGCWFASWLKKNLPDRYDYVLLHHADPDPDLEDREILASIEDMLRRTLAPYGVPVKTGSVPQRDNDAKKREEEPLRPGPDETPGDASSTEDESRAGDGQIVQAEADRTFSETRSSCTPDTEKKGNE